MRKTTFLKKNQKKFHKYLAERKNSRTFATAKENQAGHLARRDGRVVDYNGLENRRTERYRGFESLSLRKSLLKEISEGFFHYHPIESYKPVLSTILICNLSQNYNKFGTKQCFCTKKLLILMPI